MNNLRVELKIIWGDIIWYTYKLFGRCPICGARALTHSDLCKYHEDRAYEPMSARVDEEYDYNPNLKYYELEYDPYDREPQFDN